MSRPDTGGPKITFQSWSPTLRSLHTLAMAPAPQEEEPRPRPLPPPPLPLGQRRAAVSPARETSSRKVAVVPAASAPPLLLFLLVPTQLKRTVAAPLSERSLHHPSARHRWSAPRRRPPPLSPRAYLSPGGTAWRTCRGNLILARVALT